MLGTVLLIIHIIVAISMCIVILMQSAKGEGLSGAFGLGQGTTSFFGADTANVLVKITAVLAVVFMLTSLSLAYIQSRKARPVALESEAGDETSMTGPVSEEAQEAEEAPVPDGGEVEGPGARRRAPNPAQASPSSQAPASPLSRRAASPERPRGERGDCTD